MKKVVSFFIFIIFAIAIFSVEASAISKREKQIKIGQKIFKKKFRRYCRFSGVRFAKKHTQDEWEEIWEERQFRKETKKICPRLNLRKIKRSWWKYIYRFTYEYGEGGSHVPKC